MADERKRKADEPNSPAAKRPKFGDLSRPGPAPIQNSNGRIPSTTRPIQRTLEEKGRLNQSFAPPPKTPTASSARAQTNNSGASGSSSGKSISVPSAKSSGFPPSSISSAGPSARPHKTSTASAPKTPSVSQPNSSKKAEVIEVSSGEEDTVKKKRPKAKKPGPASSPSKPQSRPPTSTLRPASSPAKKAPSTSEIIELSSSDDDPKQKKQANVLARRTNQSAAKVPVKSGGKDQRKSGETKKSEPIIIVDSEDELLLSLKPTTGKVKDERVSGKEKEKEKEGVNESGKGKQREKEPDKEKEKEPSPPPEGLNIQPPPSPPRLSSATALTESPVRLGETAGNANNEKTPLDVAMDMDMDLQPPPSPPRRLSPVSVPQITTEPPVVQEVHNAVDEKSKEPSPLTASGQSPMDVDVPPSPPRPTPVPVQPVISSVAAVSIQEVEKAREPSPLPAADLDMNIDLPVIPSSTPPLSSPIQQPASAQTPVISMAKFASRASLLQHPVSTETPVLQPAKPLSLSAFSSSVLSVSRIASPVPESNSNSLSLPVTPLPSFTTLPRPPAAAVSTPSISLVDAPEPVLPPSTVTLPVEATPSPRRPLPIPRAVSSTSAPSPLLAEGQTEKTRRKKESQVARKTGGGARPKPREEGDRHIDFKKGDHEKPRPKFPAPRPLMGIKAARGPPPSSGNSSSSESSNSRPPSRPPLPLPKETVKPSEKDQNKPSSVAGSPASSEKAVHPLVSRAQNATEKPKSIALFAEKALAHQTSDKVPYSQKLQDFAVKLLNDQEAQRAKVKREKKTPPPLPSRPVDISQVIDLTADSDDEENEVINLALHDDDQFLLEVARLRDIWPEEASTGGAQTEQAAVPQAEPENPSSWGPIAQVSDGLVTPVTQLVTAAESLSLQPTPHASPSKVHSRSETRESPLPTVGPEASSASSSAPVAPTPQQAVAASLVLMDQLPFSGLSSPSEPAPIIAPIQQESAAPEQSQAGPFSDIMNQDDDDGLEYIDDDEADVSDSMSLCCENSKYFTANASLWWCDRPSGSTGRAE
ncbi:hypothetical protein C8J56DRAFT_13404 [Mycena floridula]|nr:hypothetical protein C8J56DRAFT_13404 [Mycena floridula]